MGPVEQTVRQSARVELLCMVSGFPLPQVEWLTSGLTVMQDRNVTVTESSSQFTVNSILTLRSIQLSDAGLYVCLANNSLGLSTAQANVTVYSKITWYFDLHASFCLCRPALYLSAS